MDTAREVGRPYRPRVIDGALARALAASGAVVIEGARASGKTMTALHAAASYVFLDDPEAALLLEVAPHSLLDGPTPRLLDEWQVAPALWNLVRRAVDASAEPGHFILTGSAVPADDITRHTGAGRFLRLRQRTMSWWEKADEPPARVSLAALFDGERPTTDLGLAPTLDSVIQKLLQPGFPAMTALPVTAAADRLRGYIDDIARTDIQRIAAVRHSPEVITHLIAALARSVASEVTFTTLAADIRAVAPGIDVETVSHYVGLLQRLFLVETQLPWTPTLRSRARVRRAPRLHLVDPALAAAALSAGATRLRADLATVGTLFESAVVHDLTVLASPLGAEIRHYRDSNGHEIDAVIILPDGRWGAVEIKLGAGQLTAATTSLGAAVAQIDTRITGEPIFRLVVTGTGPVLVTDDGTVTAPLSALMP